VFLDTGSPTTGKPIIDKISEELDACEVIVVLVTLESLRSKQVEFEWKSKVEDFNSGMPVFIIPVWLSGPGPRAWHRGLRHFAAICLDGVTDHEVICNMVVDAVFSAIKKPRSACGPSPLRVHRLRAPWSPIVLGAVPLLFAAGYASNHLEKGLPFRVVASGPLLLALCVAAVYIHSDVKQQLVDARSRAHCARRVVRPPVRRLYVAWLSGALWSLDRLTGRRLFSARVFGVCLTVSFVYSVFSFLVAWVLGGPRDVGQIDVFPADCGWVLRSVVASLFLVVPWLVYKLGTYVSAALLPLSGASHVMMRPLVSLLLSAILVTGAVFMVTVGASFVTAMLLVCFAVFMSSWSRRFSLEVIASVVVMTLLGASCVMAREFFGAAWYVAITAIGTTAAPAAMAGTGSNGLGRQWAAEAGAVVAIGAVVFTVGPEVSSVLFGGSLEASGPDLSSPVQSNGLLFFAFLPVCNAIWDAISWAASRKMARQLLHRSGARRVLCFLLIDAAIAAGTMVGLVVTLVVCLTVWNSLMVAFGGLAPYNLVRLAEDAAADPFGANGLWVTTMLASTLVPTLIHVVIAVAALLAGCQSRAQRGALAAKLEGSPNAQERSMIALQIAVCVPLAGLAFLLAAYFVGWLAGGSYAWAADNLLALVKWLVG
jgi:hypothetical protein